MKLLITTLLLGVLQVTSYRSISKQTDNSPTWTSIGDRTTMFGCAVSRDFLQDGTIKYGDTLYIEGFGFRVVNDCMASRHNKAIDLFVRTWEEEHKIGLKHRKVWIIRGNFNEKEASNISKDKRVQGKH